MVAGLGRFLFKQFINRKTKGQQAGGGPDPGEQGSGIGQERFLVGQDLFFLITLIFLVSFDLLQGPGIPFGHGIFIHKHKNWAKIKVKGGFAYRGRPSSIGNGTSLKKAHFSLARFAHNHINSPTFAAIIHPHII